MQLSKGYTIIEVLIALVIFAVALLGLFAASSVIISNNLLNLERNTAINIASESLELARNSPNLNQFSLNNGTLSCEDSLNKCTVKRPIRSIPFCFGRYYKVIPVTGSSNLKKVIVEVCWKHKGKLKKITDETIVGRQ